MQTAPIFQDPATAFISGRLGIVVWYATRLADLKQSQAERREAVERERGALLEKQHAARHELQQRHSARLKELGDGHRQALRDVRAARHRDSPKGLAAFLGRVTGVSLIRKAVHRYEDGRRLKAYKEERAALKASQQEQARALALRHDLQGKEVERRLAALERVDRRELDAFMRDERTEQRIRDRGGKDRLQSITSLVERQTEERQGPDLLDAFSKQRRQTPTEAPDLISAFRRAAFGSGEAGSKEGVRTPADDRQPDAQPSGRDSDRNR